MGLAAGHGPRGARAAGRQRDLGRLGATEPSDWARARGSRVAQAGDLSADARRAIGARVGREGVGLGAQRGPAHSGGRAQAGADVRRRQLWVGAGRGSASGPRERRRGRVGGRERPRCKGSICVRATRDNGQPRPRGRGRRGPQGPGWAGRPWGRSALPPVPRAKRELRSSSGQPCCKRRNEQNPRKACVFEINIRKESPFYVSRGAAVVAGYRKAVLRVAPKT